MTAPRAETTEIGKRLDRVAKTPAGFELFVAIHDFVERFEAHASFSRLTLPSKYRYLKEVHQGIKDTGAKPEGDLGHERYMIVQDLIRIKQKDVSDSNPLWKKREALRAVSADVYEILNDFLAEKGAAGRS